MKIHPFHPELNIAPSKFEIFATEASFLTEAENTRTIPQRHKLRIVAHNKRTPCSHTEGLKLLEHLLGLHVIPMKVQDHCHFWMVKDQRSVTLVSLHHRGPLAEKAFPR